MVLFAIVILLQPEFPAIVSTSRVSSKSITVEVSREQLAKSPAWDEKDENPPISARRAIVLSGNARNAIARVLDEEGKMQWSLRSVSLRPTQGGKWYWLVRYEANSDEDIAGGAEYVDLIVLMSGIVVTPTIRETRK